MTNSLASDLEKVPYYQPCKYAITINPNDDYNRLFAGNGRKTLQLHSTNTNTRYTDLAEIVMEALEGHRYTLYYDVSCPTEINIKKFPRLHLHGIIDLSMSFKLEDFLLITSQKLAQMASVKMQKLETPEQIEIWQKYCRKYTNVMRSEPITHKTNFVKRTEPDSVDLSEY